MLDKKEIYGMSWHFIYVRNGTYQSILGQDCTSTVLCVQGKRFLPRSKAAVRRGKKRISSRLKTRATANFIYPSDDSTFIRVIIPCNSPVERLPVDPWHIKRIDFLQKKKMKISHNLLDWTYRNGTIYGIQKSLWKMSQNAVYFPEEERGRYQDDISSGKCYRRL